MFISLLFAVQTSSGYQVVNIEMTRDFLKPLTVAVFRGLKRKILALIRLLYS